MQNKTPDTIQHIMMDNGQIWCAVGTPIYPQVNMGPKVTAIRFTEGFGISWVSVFTEGDRLFTSIQTKNVAKITYTDPTETKQ